MKIAILGGGQLARMLAISAYSFGIEVICIDPMPECCAGQVTKVIQAHFDDVDEIARHCEGVGVMTIETENLPIDAVSHLSKLFSLKPGVEVLRMTQDRIFEKTCCNHLGIPTTGFLAIDNAKDLTQAIDTFGFPLVLKTTRNGYDGKGQQLILDKRSANEAIENMGHNALVAEQFVSFDAELSLIAVRSQTSEEVFYPLTHNQHREGILRLSEAPYNDERLQGIAEGYARAIFNAFRYVGVLTLEFFLVGDKLLVNEIAPRVHNSGHWTLDGAETSQFENHLRAILGWPLGSTKAQGFSTMINCLGTPPHQLQELLSIEGLHYHSYGKAPKPQRKLAHLTLCDSYQSKLREKVAKAKEILNEC
jgi:5-(carboxyamino)imidazole ribonucleotide synthase